LLADLKRKSIEPIALAAGVAVRTLQEFLAFLDWDHDRANDMLQRMVADEHGSFRAVGVIDASGHAKQGRKTPGVRRQYCGETGKIDNCVVGQHLLYTDNDPKNPFTCMLADAKQTQRLRGEKSADHAGAGGRSGQRPGDGDLELQLACAG
jgi:SRSO17 transposase